MVSWGKVGAEVGYGVWALVLVGGRKAKMEMLASEEMGVLRERVGEMVEAAEAC